MRILMAISIVALVALLWASASIVQHIRLTRRRRMALGLNQTKAAALVVRLPARKHRPLETPEPQIPKGVLGISGGAITPVLRAVTPQPSNPVASTAPLPFAYASASRPAVQAIPVRAVPRLVPAAAVAAPVMATPAEPVEVLPAPVPSPAVVEPVIVAAPEPVAELPARLEPRRAIPEPVAAAEVADPHAKRPVRSAYPQPVPATFASPMRRPDWVYFNKDMGDLSDPLPGRLRDRARSR